MVATGLPAYGWIAWQVRRMFAEHHGTMPRLLVQILAVATYCNAGWLLIAS